MIGVDTHQVAEVIGLATEHGPHALALDAAADLRHVSVEEGPAGPGGPAAIDPRTDEVVARYSADAPVPHRAVPAPDGTAACTTDKSGLFASRTDLTGRTPVRRIPVVGSEGLALSPTGDRLYIIRRIRGSRGDARDASRDAAPSSPADRGRPARRAAGAPGGRCGPWPGGAAAHRRRPGRPGGQV
ncbi:hypothetical protein [Streptomyces sp. x-80]|uniref:hypothetical protein n=1 Tax=Streptomyces sp. x-80 TaxID=2789282 RepID=UPI003980484A